MGENEILGWLSDLEELVIAKEMGLLSRGATERRVRAIIRFLT